jgi:hypothetical protein
VKTRLLILTVLAVAVLALPPAPSTATSSIPCDQANAACEAFADADMSTCVLVYGSDITPDQFQSCVAHAVHLYQGCMGAHGCPINN